MTAWPRAAGIMKRAGLDGPQAVSVGILLNMVVQKWLVHAQLSTTAIYVGVGC